MRDMLKESGFESISIVVKENASDIIKDWMPGSGAEKFVTSVYVTATKPGSGASMRDNPVQRAPVAPVLYTPNDPGAPADAGC